VTFDDVRVLVKTGDRTRELSGVLSLGNGQLAILDKPGGTPLVSLPYSSLTGAAYSRSKQPKWKDADGKSLGQAIWNAAWASGEATIEYKWINPVSHLVEQKVGYFKKVGEDICGVGAYRP